MTANQLQQEFIEEIERLTADLALTDKRGNQACMKGYPQAIPIVPTAILPAFGEDGQEPAEEGPLFPYFVVRLDSIQYRNPEAEGANQAHVMVVFAVYDEDPGLKGYFSLTSAMERVVLRFRKDTVLGAFWCERKMGVAYQEDDTYPQFFGGVEMTWNLPEEEMEDVW